MWKIKYDPVDKKWFNVTTPRLYHDNVSIGFAAITELSKFGDRVVQISDNNGVTITAKEMKSKILRSAVHMERLQLNQGDIIGVVARNNHNLAPIVLGALLNGYTLNAIDVTFSQDDIEHMFNITKPKVIVCDFDQHDKVKNVIGSIKLSATVITLDQKVSGCDYIDDYYEETPKEMFYIPVPLKDGINQPAFIVCSSGTTGYHKGICISHAQLIKKIFGRANHNPDVKLYCSSSLYWLSGIDHMLTSILDCVPRIITTEPFTAENLFKMIENYKINRILIPPSYLALVLKSPELETANLTSVQLFSVVGSAAPVSYYEKIQKLLPNGIVITVYGLTELCGLCSINITRGNFSSAGLLVNDIEVRIIDEAGNRKGPNESGEIVLRDTHFPFLGYYKDTESTKAVFSKDGWICSGDIGHFDDHGLLYMTDRKKDIIKYRNYHVSPNELEDIILNFDGVRSACVVGIPDPTNSDLPAALIVKDDDFREVEFLKYIENKLPDYKSLRGGIYYVESIPQTANGKLKRKEAKEIAVKIFRTK